MKKISGFLLSLCLACVPGIGFGDDDRDDRDDDDDGHRRHIGLNRHAARELIESGVTKYMGDFNPVSSEEIGDGWIKHTFDPAAGDGPICIAGTPYSVYTKAKNPRKLLIMMQGGGACWQDFYFCNILAEDQAPPPPPVGIWGDFFETGSGRRIRNPLKNHSIVYMPYCDGSVFAGDNAVADSNFPLGPVRHHRGLRNATAGIDLAKDLFPRAKRILLAGSSAGGVGASGMAPFLTRFAYGNRKRLRVFNDAGPVAINEFDIAGITARAEDWRFGQFFPESCGDCSDTGQGTALINWRLENDSTIREAFYSTDGDATNRFFLGIPTQALYRQLILTEHGALNAAHPRRYKRFIRSGDDSHIALQSDLLYTATAENVPLYEWLDDFVRNKRFWVDIVEDFVPL